MSAALKHSPDRDRAWGRFLARKGAARVIAQAENGNGCHHDNVRRIQEWRNKYMTVPIEQTLGNPVESIHQRGVDRGETSTE